jgi:MYXO-CTERM domain-containing protein
MFAVRVPAVLGVIAIAACSSTEDPGVGTTRSAIIGGELDMTHRAVVAVHGHMGSETILCSGTLVKVDPQSHVGYVLTAAHCLRGPADSVLMADDFSASSAINYDAIDSRAHPSYQRDSDWAYDFGIVRVAGVDASTPTIPILAAADDTLAAGSAVTSVGYGRVTARGGADVPNSQRRRIARTLSATDATSLTYSLNGGGLCDGDSGGPVLATVGDKEYVAGIHSVATDDCKGDGISTRVTSAEGTVWLAEALSQPAPIETCDLCKKRVRSGTGVCAERRRACTANAECNDLRACILACTSPFCHVECENQHPLQMAEINALADCACRDGCSGVCRDDSTCRALPRCGYTLGASACSTCTENACCDAIFRCARDGTCYDCLKNNDRPAACETNPQRLALQQCRASQCSVPCSIDAPPSTNHADPPANTTSMSSNDSSGCSATAAPPDRSPVALVMAGLLLWSRRRRSRSALPAPRRQRR